MSLEESIKIAIVELGEILFENLEIKYSKDTTNGYLEVIRENNHVEIKYSETAGLFRGLTLIKENILNKNYDIKLNKSFKKNGYMIDCSRNGVANITNLKKIVLLQALMGQNQILLYTEETYTLEKYPYFGYLRGSYTKEEIKEIVEYAENFGIEVVPCIQTLGHLERLLHWAPMHEYKDGNSTLLIGEPKVYELIEEMIKFSRECFKSKEIHIGMDESTDIGLGRYLEEHPFTNRVKLFSDHLAKVIKICKQYDFNPMIWSDMFFRLNSKNGSYCRDDSLPEETLKLMPEGIKLVYWDYYNTDQKVYDRMNKYHLETGREVAFAGGSWRWKGYTPAISMSFKLSTPAIKSAVEKGIKDVFVTAWGDNGSEASIMNTLPIMCLYSTADYFQSYDLEKVDSLLYAVIGERVESMFKMDLPDMPDNRLPYATFNPSKYFLFQDPMNGLFDKHVEPHFAANYKSHAECLHKLAQTSTKLGYVYDVLANLCDVLSIKVDLGVRLRKAYKDKDNKALEQISAQIPALLEKIDIFNESHRKQWYTENKMFGFDVIDGRVGFLKNRILSTKKLIDAYLKGELKKLEELETELLCFDGMEKDPWCNMWGTIVTAQNVNAV